MSLALLVSMAAAAPLAPWNFTVSAELPRVSSTMPVYRVVGGSLVSTDDLQDIFGLSGTPEWLELGGGVEVVADSSTFIYNFDAGGSAFHDLGLSPGERRIRTVSDDALWQSSEALLEDLGLLDLPLVALQPDRTGGCTVERYDAHDVVFDRYSCGQAVAWSQSIEGWPTFGPGSDVAVHFGDRGVIVGFESTVRHVEIDEELDVVPPQMALRHALAEGARTGRWNMLRADTRGLVSVDIDSIELGYFVPDRSATPERLVPVYAIHGVATLKHGEPAEVLWYEPAVRGVGVPELALAPRI